MRKLRPEVESGHGVTFLDDALARMAASWTSTAMTVSLGLGATAPAGSAHGAICAGGACRAWNRRPSDSQTDLDAPPTDCTALLARARSLLLSALDHLGVAHDRWLAAALPLPDAPSVSD